MSYKNTRAETEHVCFIILTFVNLITYHLTPLYANSDDGVHFYRLPWRNEKKMYATASLSSEDAKSTNEFHCFLSTDDWSCDRITCDLIRADVQRMAESL